MTRRAGASAPNDTSEPIATDPATTVPRESFKSFDPTQFSTVYDPSQDTQRMVDMNTVEHNGYWELRWSDPKLVLERKRKYGYEVITPDCIVTHRDRLELHEFRVLGGHKLDYNNNNVVNASGQILIAIPKHVWFENQRKKLEFSRERMRSTVLGDPNREMPRLMQDAAAAQKIADGTFLQKEHAFDVIT
jgi:hypothetical protein